MEGSIKGGYILISRKLIESEIFKKPPLYLKVWIFLLSKAQHKEYKNLKRGQLVISIPEIQEACSYMVGYRKEKPTKKQIFDIISWLRNPCERNQEGNYEGNKQIADDLSIDDIMNETMIVTAKVTHGLLVTIDKYSVYQDSKNYERNNDCHSVGNNESSMRQDEKSSPKVTAKEQRTERQGNNINKNDNNDNNIYIDHFDSFYNSYPKKVGKAPARKAFAKLHVDESLLNEMLSAIKKQTDSKQWQDKQFIPNPATWLNQRRWEDETEETAGDGKVAMIEDGVFKF